MVGVSSTEEGGAQGGAQGGFTIGRAPTIENRLATARKQFAGLKTSPPREWHLKVYSAFKQDPAFKGNIEAQLDYLEENGFRDMNPPSYSKQYKPITTRAEARERLEAMEKRMAKNSERGANWKKEHPEEIKESGDKKHIKPSQRAIENLQRERKKYGFLSPENQAKLEKLLEQRTKEGLAYKQQNASTQVFKRMIETEKEAFPRMGVFPSSAAEGGGGGGGFAAAAPGVAPTGEDAYDDIDDIDDIEEDL